MPFTAPTSRSISQPIVQPLEHRVMLHAGVIDTDFGPNGVVSIPIAANDVRLNDVAVMSDGRVVVVGTSRSDGTLTVLRLRPDGTYDPTFGSGGRAVSRIGSANALAVEVQPDGKAVVAGQRGADYFVLRYRTNGKHDRTFGDGGLVVRNFGTSVSSARDLEILDDGSIVVAGNASQADGSIATGVAKFDSSGGLVRSFGGDDGVGGGMGDGTIVTKFGFPLSAALNVTADRMTIADDGDILLAGRFEQGSFGGTGATDVAVMRLRADGTPDPTFGDNGIAVADFGTEGERATGVAVDAQGRPVVSVDAAFGVLRLRPDGRRDSTFGTNGLARASAQPGAANDVIIDADGDYVLAGEVNGSPRVARLSSGGTPDADFGDDGVSAALPFGPSEVARLVEAPDNTYLVAGRGLNDSASGRSFVLSKIFAESAPAASLDVRDITAPLTGSHVFRVQWRDSDGIA